MTTLREIIAGAGVAEADLLKSEGYVQKFGGQLEKVLFGMGSLSEEMLVSIYSNYLSVPLVSDGEALGVESLDGGGPLQLNFLLSHGWLPLAYCASDKRYSFLSKDPLNWEVRQALELAGVEFDLCVASEAVFEQVSAKLSSDAAQDELDTPVLSTLEEDRLREMASQAPTINLLNSLLTRGLQQRASDLHLEPVDGRYRARFRIDGVLHDVETLPRNLQLPLISRVKILAGMDIAEKRRPQDGKIQARIANTALDIRASTLPLADGESVVLRFLRKDSVTYAMDALDLEERLRRAIEDDLQKTSGVILLTGPTGSGKTSTLYTFLSTLNTSETKIITLEDPVEYELRGLNQVQVRPEIGFSFATGLRSILRQDPDVIMVGEIRDRETCEIAMQSALTGHLVMSTVHTNSAPATVTRLIDLGVDEYLLNAALTSVMAQRLVRRLCSECRRLGPALGEASWVQPHLKPLGLTGAEHTWEAAGCEACSDTGYHGRTAIMEYLPFNETVQALDKGQRFEAESRRYMAEQGYPSLAQHGLQKALRGVTSLAEVVRVCGA